jgi:hypothetical protein
MQSQIVRVETKPRLVNAHLIRSAQFEFRDFTYTRRVGFQFRLVLPPGLPCRGPRFWSNGITTVGSSLDRLGWKTYSYE